MPGKAFVDERVIGIDDVPSRPIAGNKIGEIETRLLDHRVHEPPVSSVLRIEFPVGIGVVDLVELEPGIEELLHKTFRFRLVQQAIDFCSKRFGLAKLSSVEPGHEVARPASIRPGKMRGARPGQSHPVRPVARNGRGTQAKPAPPNTSRSSPP